MGCTLKKDSLLGRSVAYSSSYNPNVLHAIARQLNRQHLDAQHVQFYGEDRWHMYEVSWLNAKGKPHVAVGEVSIAADSINLVESKSFKLYLNSFNQTQFASIHEVKHRIEQDLRTCVQGRVSVNLTPVSEALNTWASSVSGQCIDDLDLAIDCYTLNTDFLKNSAVGPIVDECLYSHLLKSNCLVTNQPDWGSVFIHYQGRQINPEALLRYLISFRSHHEFHEHCVERIFADIHRFCRPNKLTVYANYTRRGGLDINPFRSTEKEKHFENTRIFRQ